MTDGSLPAICVGGCVFLWVLAEGLIVLWFTSTIRKRRKYQDTPTSKASGVFIGEVELKGTAESPAPLTSHFSRKPVVYYDWSISEEWKRTRVETTTDAKGKPVTRTVTDTGWTPIAGSRKAQLFALKDDTGFVQINPSKANIRPVSLFARTCSVCEPDYYRLGPNTAIPNSTGRRMFNESGIPIHQELYVFGHSRLREDVVAPEMAWAEGKPLLISTDREETIIKGSYFGTFFSAALCLAGAWFIPVKFLEWFAPWIDNINVIGLWAAAIAACLLFLSWVWEIHCGAVRMKNRTLQAKSNLDVEFQRRHSLIVPLIEVVKGICQHEKELLTDLAALRSQQDIEKTDDAVKKTALSSLQKPLTAVVEKYPNLKANENFQNLQKNLIETEERIALARGYYNDTVKCLNDRLEMFPEGYIARMSGLRKFDYLRAEDFEVQPPKISISADAS